MRPVSWSASISLDHCLSPQGDVYILLVTVRFSRRADMFNTTAAEFTANGTASIFVNRCMTLCGCPTTLISDNGPQFTSKSSPLPFTSSWASRR